MAVKVSVLDGEFALVGEGEDLHLNLLTPDGKVRVRMGLDLVNLNFTLERWLDGAWKLLGALDLK